MSSTLTQLVSGLTEPRAELDTTRWAVVIPSHNHAGDAIICLESLRSARQRPNRVVLVDDASTEDAVAAIIAWATRGNVSYSVIHSEPAGKLTGEQPWLTIIASKTNSGFSVSCNKGLRYVRDHTDAPFVLLLNNDAALSEWYFPDFADGVSRIPKVGLASGTIFEWDRQTVWYAGGRFNPMRAVAEHNLQLPADGQPRTTEFVCGCTMLIAREVLETVGLLPECYSPCYCEDADYSLKAQRAGFALVYVPAAKAFHRVSSSLGREMRPPQVIYWFNRNRGYAMRRNYTGWRRAAGIGYLAVTKPLRALWELLNGRPRSASAFVRGTAAGLFRTITPDL